jgi:hypothetical protein
LIWFLPSLIGVVSLGRIEIPHEWNPVGWSLNITEIYLDGIPATLANTVVFEKFHKLRTYSIADGYFFAGLSLLIPL